MDQPKIDLRQRTKSFALSVVRMFSALPKTTEAQVLGRQLLRSGTSIGANYREAYRGRSTRNGASGLSDMHGRAARVAASELGNERMNLLPNAVIASVKSKRRRIGSSFLSQPRSFPQRNSRLCLANVMNSQLFLSVSSNSPKQLRSNS